MRLPRLFRILFAVCWTAAGASAVAGDALRFPSPNKHFAVKITTMAGDDGNQSSLELIEKSTGQIMTKLGVVYGSHIDDAVVVWSADSKRVAYGIRREKDGEAGVFYWNGSAFEDVALPENMPDPNIHFRKGADGDVKNYGGAVQPVRWLKSGALEMSNDLMLLSRVDDRTYMGKVLFTVVFDAQHHARVKAVGKTRTTVD